MAKRSGKRSRPRQRQGAAATAVAPGRSPGAAWAIVPATLAALVYLGSLNNPFVYDDVATVVDNPSLQQPLDWGRVLLHDRFRPVANLSYALDASLWDGRATGFHATNVALHALAVALFFLLARAWARDAAAGPPPPAQSTADRDDDHGERSALRVALVAASLFALHPLMTEAVGYTSARPEVLCAVWSVAALLLGRRALRRGSTAAWLAAAACWLLALGSREIAVAVPLVLLAYDRLLHRGGDELARRRRLWLLYLPTVALAAAGGALRVASSLREAGATPGELGRHLLTDLPVAWRYLRLLLWPAGQSLVHPANGAVAPLGPRVVLAAAGLVAVAVAAWMVRRRLPLVALGLLWFPLFLAPASALAPLVGRIVEHRAYLPSCGAFLVLAVGFDRLLTWWRAGGRRPARLPDVAALALLAVLGVLTMARNRIWSDPVALWRDAAAKAPLHWAPHYALGDALRDAEGCAAAIPSYRRAVELRPDDNRARINLGVCLAQTRSYGEAGRVFQDALAVEPGSAAAHGNLGWLANLARRPDVAARHFRAALASDPDNAVALVNLAMLNETVLGNPAEALRLCRQLLRVHPESSAAADCIRRNEQRAAGAG